MSILGTLARKLLACLLDVTCDLLHACFCEYTTCMRLQCVGSKYPKIKSPVGVNTLRESSASPRSAIKRYAVRMVPVPPSLNKHTVSLTTKLCVVDQPLTCFLLPAPQPLLVVIRAEHYPI